MLLRRFKEFCILAGLYWLGEFLSNWLGLLLPGSLIGMLMLTLLLFSNILKLEQVEQAADYLLQHLILLFVPAGVGIMIYDGNSVSSQAAGIILTILLSTVVVLAVAGKTADWVIAWLSRPIRVLRQSK